MGAGVDLFQVRSADAAGGNLDQQFAGADGGDGDRLDAHVVDAAIDYGAHGCGDSGGDRALGVGGLGSHPCWCDLTHPEVRGAAPQCFGKPFYYFRPFGRVRAISRA